MNAAVLSFRPQVSDEERQHRATVAQLEHGLAALRDGLEIIRRDFIAGEIARVTRFQAEERRFESLIAIQRHQLEREETRHLARIRGEVPVLPATAFTTERCVACGGKIWLLNGERHCACEAAGPIEGSGLTRELEDRPA